MRGHKENKGPPQELQLSWTVGVEGRGWQSWGVQELGNWAIGSTGGIWEKQSGNMTVRPWVGVRVAGLLLLPGPGVGCALFPLVLGLVGGHFPEQSPRFSTPTLRVLGDCFREVDPCSWAMGTMWGWLWGHCGGVRVEDHEQSRWRVMRERAQDWQGWSHREDRAKRGFAVSLTRQGSVFSPQ